MPTLNPRIAKVLLPAYAPCPAFTGVCRGMRWAPRHGHIPRGFCGATGALADVKLVLVGAEPGDPHGAEMHEGTRRQQIQSAFSYSYECFRSGTDLYHRNMRRLLTRCWPDETFEQHMRKAWITDSILCSAPVESGYVSVAVWRECRARYLAAQLTLFPAALVVALGVKAQERLAGFPGVVKAFAVAPPGCNRRGAQESWAKIARLVRKRAR